MSHPERRDSRHSRRESGEIRRESRESRTGSGDSRIGSGDSRRGSGDSRRGSGDSRRGSGDSRRGSGDSRVGSTDSRSAVRGERKESTSSGSPRGSERILSAGSSGSSPLRPRDESELPTAFGRIAVKKEETDLDVLQRMKKCFTNEPLCYLTRLLDGEERVKVWTRNFRSVRGICTGYVVAFDKHWNLILQDVAETFIKPKRSKTPFLNTLPSANDFQELPHKESKPKKKQIQEELAEGKSESEKKSKKKRKKRIKTVQLNRTMKQIFIRGDSIVMFGIDRKPSE